MVIFFNPSCSKCNEALDLLKAARCEVTIRNYLAEPPSVEELKSLVTLLKCRPIDLVRQKEPLFKEMFSGRDLPDAEWLRVLSEHPVLIERPIVVEGTRAVIGRPPVRVMELVESK